MRVLVAALLAVVSLAPPADAAVVRQANERVFFFASPGERNVVAIAPLDPFGRVVVSDRGGAPLREDAPACVRLSPSEVGCTGAIGRAVVLLGDRDDTYVDVAGVPAAVFGQGGRDTFRGSRVPDRR